MKDLALLEPPPSRALQTRASFPPPVPNSVLGTVQIVDEAGFAYLSGDLDFGATGKEEIFQNIKYIVLTEYFSVPLDREFGLDYSMVDKPMAVAEAVFCQEVAMKIALYEPRAQFREIKFEEDELNGKLMPSIRVDILSISPGPSLYRTALEEPIPVETKATIAAADAFSGKITGLQGKPGDAGSIIVGQTITGDPGEPALVVNVGTPSVAVLDFTVPEGLQGEPGKGIVIKGTVANYGALPTTGQEEGDIGITADTGHGWSWNGATWIDVGEIKGPKGDTGNTGATGPQGNTGNTGATGAPGQVWRGAWNAVTQYNVNDAVEYLGSTHICTGPSINEPPSPAGGPGFWTPPLATTALRGSIPPLSPSNQQGYYLRGDNSWSIATPVAALPPAPQLSYYLRGDNTWQWLADAIAAATPPGTPIQAKAYTIQDSGSTGAVASVYAFTSGQGTLWGTYYITPKYANSIIRVSFACEAQIQTASGWIGYALFRTPDGNPLCQAWNWISTVNAGNTFAGAHWYVAGTTSMITFQLKGAVGQSGSYLFSRGNGAVFIDEIKQ